MIEQLPVPLEDIFDSWTKVAGYPTIQVSHTGNEVQLELINLRGHWFQVPVSYAKSTDLDFTETLPDVWLSAPPSHVHSVPMTANEFIIVNKKQSGYYRVLYDTRSFGMILGQLLEKHTAIHEVNRAQLVDDTAYFAFTGQLEYSSLFELLGFIYQERGYVSWQTINRRLKEVHHRLKGSLGYDRLETFLREMTADAFDVWGLQKIIARPSTRMAREAVADLACLAGNARCVRETLAIVDKLVSCVSPLFSILFSF